MCPLTKMQTKISVWQKQQASQRTWQEDKAISIAEEIGFVWWPSQEEMLFMECNDTNFSL